MRIILCLDYSPFTQKVLATMRDLLSHTINYELSVVHIIDETLLASGTGEEMEVADQLRNDSQDLKRLCTDYLGADFKYIEEYGLPRHKLDEVLAATEHDFLVVGSHSRSLLGARLLGGVAEHLLRNSNKPVLVIP